MLVVLGVLAVLVTVVIMVLNPLEFLKKARDSRRMVDLQSLNKALHFAEFNNISMGSANVVYVSVPDDSAGATTTCSTLGLPGLPGGWSYQCSNSANYRKPDATGWVPVNFASLITVQNPLNILPIDPINTTSTNLYYTYVKGSWELTALFESTSYQQKYANLDNGASTVLYEIGNHLKITPDAVASRTNTTGGGGATQYTLTVSKTGEGTGTVTSNPSGINCGSTCNYDFDNNTEVTLTAEAAGGSTFTAWSGEGCSGTGTCVVTMSQARAVTANFDVAAWACGDTLTDPRDSKTYATVLIGSQCWMAEYINVGTLLAGANNMSNNASIEKYCYSDTESNCTSDGGLYQWDEAMDYNASCNGTGAPPNDACATPVQGICPLGWHIPSHYEWTTLERAVCTSGTCATDFPYDTSTTYWRGTDEGGKLKGTTICGSYPCWNSPNTGATNSSGFTAWAAGYRSTGGSFGGRGAHAYVWSSLESGTDAWSRYLGSGIAAVFRGASNKLYGFSVRCIKD